LHIQALLDQAQFRDAEKAARDWMSALEGEGKAESIDYADALDLLADTLGIAYAPLAQIQPLADRSIAVKTKLHGDQDVSIAASLNITGLRKYRTSDYPASIADFSRATKLEEAAGAHATPALIATTLNGYGLALGGKGDPKQALTLHERALTIRQQTFGAGDWRVAEVLFSLSTDYRQMGDLNRSLDFMKRSAEVFERTNPNHPSTAQAVGGLAGIYREQGQYSTARPLFEKSIQIYERNFGPDNPRLVAVYNNYGLCLKAMSDFGGASVALERAVSLSTKANGAKSATTAQALGNLGILYQQMGDLPKARQAYETALGVLEQTLGPEHEGTASVLTSLGLVLRDMGDTRAARPYIERALAIYEKRFGRDNPKTLQLVSNLGSIWRTEKNFNAALPLTERALQGYLKTLGPGNLETVAEVGVKASLLAEMGDLPKAKDLYRQAIAGFDAQIGTDSYGGAQGRAELAELELRTGNNSEALELSRRSVASFVRLFGSDYRLLAGTLSITAAAELKLGDMDKSFDDALESARIRRGNLLAVARTATERQALLYAEKGGDGLDVALQLGARGISPEQRSRLWDAVIRDRALVLDEMAERQRATRSQATPELAALNRGLTQAREDLANSVVAGPRTKEKDYSGRLGLLRVAVDDRERQLALKSVDFRNRLVREHAGFADVNAALPAGAALAAYVHYSGGYLAFVIRAGETVPAIVPIGTGKRIDTLIHGWRAQIDREREFQGREAGKNEVSYREAGTALRRAVWDPLVASLTGADKVYLTTDGLLQLVNFPALPTGKTSYLMETGPLLHLLSAERDIRDSPRAASTGDMLAMGRPAFDSRPFAGALANQFRGVASTCAGFSSLDFPDLPGSAREAQSVLQVWKSRGNAGVALTGERASKSAFEEMASGKRVIHIATHGFFLEGSCSAENALEDPLLRSGLALAGANRRAAAGPGQDDGILTAEEVASLDLESAELVVLSGCDTGSGEIRAGEGVLGLRRAFRIAGAQNLVMSLWPVTDEGAREWMTAFYQARFSRQQSPTQSVRDASLSQLRARRKTGLSTHPFYWAGFILVGGA
jgi:CHAT domain-containing protein/tetratricopeptide (TPR) repeat protein